MSDYRRSPIVKVIHNQLVVNDGSPGYGQHVYFVKLGELHANGWLHFRDAAHITGQKGSWALYDSQSNPTGDAPGSGLWINGAYSSEKWRLVDPYKAVPVQIPTPQFKVGDWIDGGPICGGPVLITNIKWDGRKNSYSLLWPNVEEVLDHWNVDDWTDTRVWTYNTVHTVPAPKLVKE